MTKEQIKNRFLRTREVTVFPGKSVPDGTDHIINPPETIVYRHRAIAAEDVTLLGQHVWGHSTYSLWDEPIVQVKKGEMIYECN